MRLGHQSWNGYEALDFIVYMVWLSSFQLLKFSDICSELFKWEARKAQLLLAFSWWFNSYITKVFPSQGQAYVSSVFSFRVHLVSFSMGIWSYCSGNKTARLWSSPLTFINFQCLKCIKLLCSSSTYTQIHSVVLGTVAASSCYSKILKWIQINAVFIPPYSHHLHRAQTR